MAGSDRPAAPAPLRREVGLLGELLGRVMSEADGADLLADVERLRRAVIRARREPTPGRQRAVERVVASYHLARAEQVARAFGVYFHLANLAEERHRVRVLRDRGRAARAAVPGSVAAAVAGIDPADLAPALATLRLHPVLTAHPTEARRRALTAALRRIDDQLDRLDDPRSAADDRGDAHRRLLEEITGLWGTAQLRADKPEPLDEVRAIMAVFDETLFRAAPALYRSLDAALQGADAGARAPAATAFLRLGSWVGGDRDGNPNVLAATTREAMAVQADHVLRGLEAVATRLARTLTVHEALTPPSPALRRALTAARSLDPALVDGITARARREPHRQLLSICADRLAATRLRHRDLAYDTPAELLADLRTVQSSLVEAGASRLAWGELQGLVWQVETFGFHLAELEVRQHSTVHAKALTELLGSSPDLATLDRLACDGWPATGAEVVVDPLDGSLRSGRADGEVVETLAVMGELQRRWGSESCRRYVVSFTSGAVDLVAVLALARLAGDVEVDVVPLFETRDDLDAAVRVLTEFVGTRAGAALLERTGRRLEVMLGYSDSAKDTGPTSAALALYRTQEALVAWAREHDVRLILFHGRGGALGRGGGPAHRAVRSQPPGSVDGGFKLTEQGEVIFARYGNPSIAHRHLEQVSAAVLLAATPAAGEGQAAAAARFAALAERVDAGSRTAYRARGAGARAPPPPAGGGGRAGPAARFAALAERVDAGSRTAYRALVEADGFAEWFARVSPLEELGGLQIGSRPARRGLGAPTGLADLRAIPWVFAWTQTRCNLPGWYGLGSGLAAAAADPGGLDELRAAYREWPMFAGLLDNAEMSLAKADRSIAERYLALGDRPDLAAAVLDELARTTELVLEVTGHVRLLAAHPVLARAVDLRNPYVDALSALQLRALGALRAGPDPEEEARLRRLLLLTVNGVAAGLQNTG